VAQDKQTANTFGEPFSSYRGGRAKHITFVVTQDCNFACRYCYMTHKHKGGRMSSGTAHKAVDYFLAQAYPQDAVVWEFIGGEPLLELELIDEICDYIKIRAYELDHRWKDNYMFSLSTNGALYDSPQMQRFLKKNAERVSIGITIDGTKAKHDMNRVYPDGRGTYDDVVRNVALWLSQFSNAETKVTFASADLPLLAESIIHLWDLGLKNVPANVVFEDVWQPGDDRVFEQQLRVLADYVIDNELYDSVNCSLFGKTIGFPLAKDELDNNWCGAGIMIAVDHEGLLYPCIRFMGYSLNSKPAYVLGDIESGIPPDRLRPFAALTLWAQSPKECIDCEVASGCAWCQGWNYDAASTPTIYERATHICNMHRARVRANEYYWARLARKTGRRREQLHRRRRHLYIMAASDAVAHCSYRNDDGDCVPISEEILQQALRFAEENFYRPVLLHSRKGPRTVVPDGFDPWHIVSADDSNIGFDDIAVHENQAVPGVKSDTAILLIDAPTLSSLADIATDILASVRRLNIIVRDVGEMSQDGLETYERQLQLLAERLVELRRGGTRSEVNLLTDRLDLEGPDDCGAGVHSLTLAPDGKLYICPAFYLTGGDMAVGDVRNGIDATRLQMCHRDRAPLCSTCEAYHCRRCPAEAHRQTLQLNVPSKAFCVAAHIELRVAARLRDRLLGPDAGPGFAVEALDPLERLARASEFNCLL